MAEEFLTHLGFTLSVIKAVKLKKGDIKNYGNVNVFRVGIKN